MNFTWLSYDLFFVNKPCSDQHLVDFWPEYEKLHCCLLVFKSDGYRHWCYSQICVKYFLMMKWIAVPLNGWHAWFKRYDRPLYLLNSYSRHVNATYHLMILMSLLAPNCFCKTNYKSCLGKWNVEWKCKYRICLKIKLFW